MAKPQHLNTLEAVDIDGELSPLYGQLLDARARTADRTATHTANIALACAELSKARWRSILRCACARAVAGNVLALAITLALCTSDGAYTSDHALMI